MTTDSDGPVAWARVLAAYWPPQSRNLRHGAWYPVVEDKREDRVALMLYGDPVYVPRRILDVRPRRPRHFSIVHRVGYVPDTSRKSMDLGARYVVCPDCSYRSALWGRPSARTCEACGHQGEIGWWE